MKVKNLIFLFCIMFIVNSCKKDPVTKPVKFTETTYQTLGTYNSLGKPDGLLKDTISPELTSFINTTLPDAKDLRISHPELFTSSAIGDITITKPSDVYVTFVWQSCDLTNSIAFYTYPTNQPPTSAKDIKMITYFFPNAGKLTALNPGDKVKIGQFDVGTSIGFVLLKGAWDPNKRTLDDNAVHFCTNDALNPEVDPNLKKHAVLIKYTPENKMLVGFEDMDRTNSSCDNDFNDVILYCTVTNP